jgi:hypothetical protein
MGDARFESARALSQLELKSKDFPSGFAASL